MPGLLKPVEQDCALTAWWFSYPNHRGLDYGWRTVDPGRTKRIYAAFRGVVKSVYRGGGDNQGWGNRVVIDHGYGVQTTYNHMATGQVRVNVGDVVEGGHYLGQMGSTGRVTGDHLHFELYLNGVRVDPRPYREGAMLPGIPEKAALQPYQREVRRMADPVLNGRVAANTGAEIGQQLKSGDIGDFDAWTRGQTVTVEGVTSDVWVRGKYKSMWFAAAGMTSQSVDGLTFISSASPLQPNQRKVIAPNLNGRSGPGTQYPWQQTLQPGDIGNFDGWTRGEKVTIGGVESDIWIRGAIGGNWFSMAGVEGDTTAGLPEVKFEEPSKPVEPTPAPGSILDPTTPWKKRTPNSPLATWVGSPNFDAHERRPAGAAPRHITLHWMAGTLSSTDATFNKPGKIENGRGTASSTNYGVGLSEIHQYVDEAAYHHGDGDRESNRWGISIEHEGGVPLAGDLRTPVVQATLDLSARLVADIAKRYGWGELVLFSGDPEVFSKLSDEVQQKYVTDFIAANPTKRLVFPHKAWVATSCPGTLDMAYIVKAANAILSPPAPEPEPEPEPQPGETREVSLADLQQIRNWADAAIAGRS